MLSICNLPSLTKSNNELNKRHALRLLYSIVIRNHMYNNILTILKILVNY